MNFWYFASEISFYAEKNFGSISQSRAEIGFGVMGALKYVCHSEVTNVSFH